MTMSIDELTDGPHREVLGLLPETLFDFGDLEQGVASVMELLAATPAELVEGVTVDDHTVSSNDGTDIVVRVYRPDDVAAGAPALYWIHGGGLVLGNVGMDDDICSAAAHELGIVVASVDYRLAPAHPYPTPLDDCEAGARWFFDQADELGVDGSRIAVGGASAGGGLAAALVQRLCSTGEARPCFQLLRYPMIDDRNQTASSHAVTDGRVWNRGANMASWAAYLGERAGGDDVPADAAPARSTDLAGLPPAVVTVGQLDLFLDEDIAYAQALLAAGVPTELHVYPHAFHGADKMVPHAVATAQMRRDEFDALRRAFGAAD